MREIRATTEIDGTPRQVWDVLVDFESYPAWNAVFSEIEGEATEGARLTVVATPPGGRSRRLHPVIVTLEPPSRMRWIERWRLPGIMTSDHLVEITASGERTRLSRTMRYRGLLVPIIWRLRGEAIRAGFLQMDAALRQRVEGSPA